MKKYSLDFDRIEGVGLTCTEGSVVRVNTPVCAVEVERGLDRGCTHHGSTCETTAA